MAKTRLSPAEAHEILRRHAEQLTAHDASYRSQSWRIHALSYAPGQTILPDPSWAGCLGLVVRGHVAVHTRQRGDDRPLVVLTPGHTFGPIRAAHANSDDTALKALVPAEVWFLCRADPVSPAEAPRSRQRATVHWSRIGRATAALAVCLALLLTVSVPSARSVVATLPIAIGQWCSQHGSPACSEQAWTVAASIAPADARPPLALGILYFERGDLGAAKRAFESASALAPDSPEALNNLGVIYLKLGSYDLAAQPLRQALALDPGSVAIEQNLGLCFLGQRAYDEALDHYLSALSLGTPQANTLTNMAIAYLETGEPVKAEESAIRALEYGQASAPVYTVLGVVALDSGQPEEALALFQQATALDAGYAQATFYQALAQLALGDTALARAALEQALAATDDETVRIQILRHLQTLEVGGVEQGNP